MSVATFITDSELRTALSNAIKIDHASLVGYWDEIISESNRAAAADIYAALIGRGYTYAQIAAWDRRREFNRHLGLYWCLVNGGGMGTYNAEFVDKFDRRNDLKDVAVTIDGVLVLPAGSDDPGDLIDGGGAVSGGRFSTDDWRFTMRANF